jgi:hypothetical protein
MECIEQVFSGTRNFGSKVTATISRNGDLVSGLYVTFDPNEVLAAPKTASFVYPNTGYALIKEVDVEIGGQKIDRQFGKWMNVWNDLTATNPSGNRGGLRGNGEFIDVTTQTVVEDLFGNGRPTQRQMTSFNVGPSELGHSGGTKVRYASVPLDFWFCRNPGLALPLIALQYHEVKIVLTLPDTGSQLIQSQGSAFGALTGTHVPKLDKVGLWADYIYLDTDERRRFAQVSHEYLIEQVQLQSVGTNNNTQFNLNFNHPVKELIWCGAPKTNQPTTQYMANANIPANGDRGLASTDGYMGITVPTPLHSTATSSVALGSINRLHSGSNSEVKWTVKLNGHERFAPRQSGYFTGTQVDNHHSGSSGVMIPESIYVYSFALKPEEHQPSGTCNFSRIDNAQLVCSGATSLRSRSEQGIDIYAVNYNVLRIMSGMGGLAYSN